MAMTKSKVKVIKSYNNLVKSGDIITFVESGGITTKKALGMDKKMNLSKEQQDEKVEVVFCGTSTMKQNEKVLLFGCTPKSKNKLLNEPYYYIPGGFQGKFNQNVDSFERQVPKNLKDSYSPLKMNKNDMDNKIKESFKKTN